MSTTTPAAETLRLLASIDASLKQLLAQSRATAPAAVKTVAPDRDLDGTYGNPELKFMPRDWTGPSFKGRRFSECPADLLDMAAETFDYFARQAEAKNELTDKGKPVADYKRMDAARCRGWAARIRNGTHVQTTPPSGNGSGAAWAGEEDPELGF